MKDYILQLLAAGKETRENICKICGVTNSYITQLLADPDFVQQLEEEKKKLGGQVAVSTTNTHDAKLDLLEDRAMTKLM